MNYFADLPPSIRSIELAEGILVRSITNYFINPNFLCVIQTKPKITYGMNRQGIEVYQKSYVMLRP